MKLDKRNIQYCTGNEKKPTVSNNISKEISVLNVKHFFCFVFISVVDPDPFFTDPYPAFHFDMDPDPAFQFDTDPDPSI